jgi:hypothetical protein
MLGDLEIDKQSMFIGETKEMFRHGDDLLKHGGISWCANIFWEFSERLKTFNIGNH